ncbi:MAG: glutamyl-tRNA reductase [Verrucomicrobia bacterium]|nr:glutamyl-tRNA reductase [Verrucomicrobiota bacterium]
MPIVAIGLSHHTCPVIVRERFAFAETKIPGALQQLRGAGLADEAVILSTCNRVELYVATSLEAAAACDGLRRFLTDGAGYQESLEQELYRFTEPQSVEHLFRVACGLDSMVLGETEILGQLKKAYEIALQNKATGSRLNKAFQRAFNVAKQIRTETNIQRGSVSVASVAVELAEKVFNSLTGRHVMVIGAGDTSEKAARALLSRGASGLVVTNRSLERAQALAAELGGRAVAFDDWAAEFEQIDIVVSSTAAPHYILDGARLEPLMKKRRNRALLLIDIAVPRDIDPAVNFVQDVFLYNIDDLQAIAEDYLKQRQQEVDRCMAIIRERARGLLEERRPCQAGSLTPSANPQV